MAKQRKSKKQRELELQAERDGQRQRFEIECQSIKEASVEWGLEERFPYDVDECVERKLQEWDSTRLQTPSGQYRDEEKLRSDYQQAFMNFVRDDFPFVIEELRNFTPLFDEIWSTQPELYIELFDRFKSEPILELYHSFRNQVEAGLNDDLPLHIFSLHDQFRWENNPYQFRFDYNWGELDPLVRALYLVHNDVDDLKVTLIRQGLLDWIVSGIDVAWFLLEGRFEEERIEQFAKGRAASFIESLEDRGNEWSFGSRAVEVFTRYLKQITSNEEVNLSCFLKLQISVIAWAKKYNLEKDWLIRYAYHFLRQFSSRNDIQIADLEIPPLLTRSLWGDVFKFEFRGWWAGDEKREDFEQQLREQFENSVKQYFHQTSRNLGLEKIRSQTKPLKLTRAKWAAFAAILNLGTTGQVLDAMAERATDDDIDHLPDHSTLDLAAKELITFGLPIVF